jgi:hypothetical protein
MFLCNTKTHKMNGAWAVVGAVQSTLGEVDFWILGTSQKIELFGFNF